MKEFESKFRCKYCGVKTQNSGKICSKCNEKAILWRQIQEMLMPVKLRKEAREREERIGGSDGKQKKGL